MHVCVQDLLDFMLLTCLSVICVSSLSFQLPRNLQTPFSDQTGSNNRFFAAWEYIVYVFTIVSISAWISAMYSEIRLKTLQYAPIMHGPL